MLKCTVAFYRDGAQDTSGVGHLCTEGPYVKYDIRMTRKGQRTWHAGGRSLPYRSASAPKACDIPCQLADSYIEQEQSRIRNVKMD